MVKTVARKEVIENYHKKGEEFELACNIYPTAPFITAKRIRPGMLAFQGRFSLAFTRRLSLTGKNLLPNCGIMTVAAAGLARPGMKPMGGDNADTDTNRDRGG
ncbi:MAG: hypothetical protein K6E92_02225 [Lachnospiraceae bacterium]|nr:hypothetical protein [Lachnospiraceae bacterium]